MKILLFLLVSLLSSQHPININIANIQDNIAMDGRCSKSKQGKREGRVKAESIYIGGISTDEIEKGQMQIA